MASTTGSPTPADSSQPIETLTLTPFDVFPNFTFGGGVDNGGLFGGSAGLLGLGRNPVSLVGQTASKYGNYFSYCLPTFSSLIRKVSIWKRRWTNKLRATEVYTIID
ncbi:hypothetical protein Vadar_000605 [Vaccinium darrowii]|uniref:Uncharacterized protein n=1 Tax=Vaccinium darrowii TaxID=229202 RepID=A0ACB7XFI0_9ERIC|nr:hypothetical protein Vadar_000605 [Vaccinium darrowii]